MTEPRYTLVFDGRLPEGEGVVSLLLPTEANIELLISKMAWMQALHLICQKTSLPALRQISTRLSILDPTKDPLLADRDMLSSAVALGTKWVEKNAQAATAEDHRAIEVLQYVIGIRDRVADAPGDLQDDFAEMAILSLSLGQFLSGASQDTAVGARSKEADELARGILRERSRRGGQTKGERSSYWHAEAIARCQRRLDVKPDASATDLAELLFDDLPRAYTPEAIAGLRREKRVNLPPLPSKVEGYRSHVRRWLDKGLLKRNRSEQLQTGR